MKNLILSGAKAAGLLGLSVTLAGCVLAPKEAKDEKDHAKSAGHPYAEVFEKRKLPDLPEHPTAMDVLHRGLLADAELEAAYFEWAAAVARIDQAGAYPNSSVSVGFTQMLDKGQIKSFDQTTIVAAPDSAESLMFPSKVAKAGELTTNMARAAGRRFVAAKFATQKRILQAWYEYVLLADKIRIREENLSLLKMTKDTTSSRLQAGAMQSDLLKADLELRLAETEQASMRAELVQMRAMLNAMLALPADAPLEPSSELPAPRALPADDAAIFAAAAKNNPELQALSLETAGRENAIDLARMQYIPDFNPSFGITGSKVQIVGLGVMLPTVWPRIRGMIAEARADLGAGQAMLRAKRQDTAAGLVAALSILRNSERQAAVFSQDILPLSQRVVDSTRRNYASGASTYLDLIDAQRMYLEARLMLSESRMMREKALADIEAIAGFDVEILATTRPSTATQPTSSPSPTTKQSPLPEPRESDQTEQPMQEHHHE